MVLIIHTVGGAARRAIGTLMSIPSAVTAGRPLSRSGIARGLDTAQPWPQTPQTASHRPELVTQETSVLSVAPILCARWPPAVRVGCGAEMSARLTAASLAGHKETTALRRPYSALLGFAVASIISLVLLVVGLRGHDRFLTRIGAIDGVVFGLNGASFLYTDAARQVRRMGTHSAGHAHCVATSASWISVAGAAQS